MGAMLAILIGAPAARADDSSDSRRPLDAITVTARRLADQQLGERVEETLAGDPMAMATHVSVHVHNGVAILSGMVFDEWDLRTIMREARHVPGVRRVINELEIEQGGD
jgi:osmotically-inducible protein OsmY